MRRDEINNGIYISHNANRPREPRCCRDTWSCGRSAQPVSRTHRRCPPHGLLLARAAGGAEITAHAQRRRDSLASVLVSMTRDEAAGFVARLHGSRLGDQDQAAAKTGTLLHKTLTMSERARPQEFSARARQLFAGMNHAFFFFLSSLRLSLVLPVRAFEVATESLLLLWRGFWGDPLRRWRRECGAREDGGAFPKDSMFFCGLTGWVPYGGISKVFFLTTVMGRLLP